MKKVYLGLAITTLLTGCMSTGQTTKATNTATAAVSASTPGNLILDPQLTAFRKSGGKSNVWVKIADKNNGLGDTGSSKDSAFDDDGSARVRFISKTDNFSAQPGLYQEVKGLQPNTDYEFSLYYYDKKGNNSPTELVFGADSLKGEPLAIKTVHANELGDAPQGALKKGFRQAAVSFNSGSNTIVKVYAKLKITDTAKINMNGDIGKATEVRIDEFKLAKK